MIVSGTLLFSFSLDVSTDAASGADAGGESSCGRDASGSWDFCVACLGGGITTTAKSGIDFRGLSEDLPNSVAPALFPSLAVPSIPIYRLGLYSRLFLANDTRIYPRRIAIPSFSWCDSLSWASQDTASLEVSVHRPRPRIRLSLVRHVARPSSGTPDARLSPFNSVAQFSHVSCSLSLGLFARAFAPGQHTPLDALARRLRLRLTIRSASVRVWPQSSPGHCRL